MVRLRSPQTERDKIFIPVITIVSILIPVVVAILMVLPDRDPQGTFSGLPLFHATLNGMTAILLLFGLYFIKNMKIIRHRFCMLTAFVLSSTFLVSYVIYHYNTGEISYGGEGIIRIIYFFILITHIALATTVVPLASFAIYRGLTNRIEKHKKIVRWTFPIWLYVAVTGVVVYLMMMPYYGV